MNAFFPSFTFGRRFERLAALPPGVLLLKIIVAILAVALTIVLLQGGGGA